MQSANPDAAHVPASRLDRLFPVLVTLTLSIIASASLFGVVREREREQLQAEFDRAADDVEAPLRTRIDGSLDVLHSIGRFYAASRAVTADEFAKFTTTAFASHPGLRSLAWLPRVSAPGPAARGDSFPIRYVEPHAAERGLSGLDPATDAGCRAALARARDENAPIAAVPPAGAALGAGAYFVFLPVYRHGAPRETRDERRRNLAGFALAVLDLRQVMEASLADASTVGIETRLVDVSENRADRAPAVQGREASAAGVHPWTTTFERAGRTWRVESVPGERYLAAHQGWRAWTVLAIAGFVTFVLIAYLNNVSGRTAAIEGLVDRRTSELTAANRRTRQIIDTAHDAFLAMDATGAIRDWNKQAEVTFGWPAQEAVGRLVADTIVPLGHREAHRKGLQHFLATGEGPVLNKRIELTALHRDGHEFPVELTIAAVPHGETPLFYAFVHDISERKRAEAELHHARDAAQAATRAKSEFLANMSHEIRTPLNGIIGMTDLALGTELTHEQREYLGLAKSSADHLLAVINDVLDFSKIEAGRLELEALDFDLREALEETVATLAARAHAKGLELVADVDAEVPAALSGDLHRLRQVVVNLLGNAIKFTEQGEVVLRVARLAPPDADGDGHVLHFSVRDTGIGISPAEQGRLFQAFTQADTSTSRRYGGTGLGLAISTRIVERMGGRMWLDSEPGRGSTFHFTARFGPASGPVDRKERVDRAPLQGLPVLVVDDNATNRRILGEMLSRWGMRPTLVESGAAALAALGEARASARPFALVLLDAMMPEMDGFALVDRIQIGDAAVLMMLSSGDRREDTARCRERGISAFLTKPIRQSMLLDAIVTALEPTLRAPERGSRTDEPAAPARRGLRLLLAEDNAVNQRLAFSVLTKRGHQVVVAGNGREALAALAAGSFDAVLMDVQMPEMDGFEATAAIRARERTSGAHIPIVAMTAHSMQGDRERCLAAGMDDYVAKPLDPRELFRVLDGLGPADVTATAPPPAVPAAFDARTALERVDGDEELLQRIVSVFLEECPQRRAELRDGIAKRDARTVERVAHNLKGSVAIFGAEAACRAAEHLEAVGRNADWAGAEQAFDALAEALARLEPALGEIRPTGASS